MHLFLQVLYTCTHASHIPVLLFLFQPVKQQATWWTARKYNQRKIKAQATCRAAKKCSGEPATRTCIPNPDSCKRLLQPMYRLYNFGNQSNRFRLCRHNTNTLCILDLVLHVCTTLLNNHLQESIPTRNENAQAFGRQLPHATSPTCILEPATMPALLWNVAIYPVPGWQQWCSSRDADPTTRP